VWSLLRKEDGAAAAIVGAALGRAGRRFERQLIALANGHDLTGQLAGIAGLAELGGSGSAEAVEVLGRCLHSPHRQSRWTTAAALGRARGRQCVGRALALLEETIGRGDERTLSGAAFGAVGLWPRARLRAERLLLAIAKSSPFGIRSVALAAHALPRQAGTRLVRECLARRQGELRAFCAPALAKWAKEGSAAARRELDSFLGDIHPAVRAAAAELVAAEDALGDLARVERLAGDPSALVRSAVAEGLRRRAEASTATPQGSPQHAAPSGPDLTGPGGAPGAALATVRGILVRLARDRAGSIRARAVLALGSLGEREVVLRATVDRDPGVRTAAAAGLDARSPADADRLLQLTRDLHPEVASAAARSLGRAGARLTGPGWDRLIELACDPRTMRAAAEAMAAVLDSDPSVILGIWHWYPVRRLGTGVLRAVARAARDPVVAEVACEAARVMDAREDLAEVLAAAAGFARAVGREDLADTMAWAETCLRAASLEGIAAAAVGASLVNMHFAQHLLAASREVGKALRARSANARERHLGEAAARLEIALAEEPEVLAAVAPHRAAASWRAVIELARTGSRLPRIEARVKATRLAARSRAMAVVEIGNVGAGLARQVVVSAAGEDRVVGHLPPGGSEEVLVAFEVNGQGPQPVAGRIAFGDGARTIRVPYQAVSEELPVGRLGRVDNPYVVGKPLPANSAMFYGREAEIAFVERALASGENGSAVVLAGQRRTGKTSLLKRLAERLGASYRTVFVDVQGLPVSDSDEFLRELAKAVASSGGGLLGSGRACGPPEEVVTGPAMASVEWVQESARRYGQPVVLLVDEFDQLGEGVRAGRPMPEVLGQFRHLMQHGDNLGFVLCGGTGMAEAVGEQSSALLNLAAYREMGPLAKEEAEALVREPLARLGIACEDAAAALAVKLSGRQPYLLQWLGYRLVERCVESGVGGVASSLVEQVADEVTSLGDVHLRYLWDGASLQGQALLRALARAKGWISSQEAAKAAGMLWSEAESALRGLVRAHLVLEAAGHYRLGIELLGRWLADEGWRASPGGPSRRSAAGRSRKQR
jgi:hypothetical protein